MATAAACRECAFGWPVHLRNSNPRRLTEGTRSSAFARDYVIHFPHVSFPESQAAFSTFPSLPFEQTGYSGRHFGMIAESRTPIDPVSIVRAARPSHLHVALIVRFSVSAQLLAAGRRLEFPASAHAPVFAHDPVFALTVMTTFRPGVEHSEER